MSQVKAPVSYGELVDKITILQIKQSKISDTAKLANIEHELKVLMKVWQTLDASQVEAEVDALRDVNAALWKIEDDIRAKERAQQFDGRFIELARAVYHTNDKRAELKRKINETLGSELVEEKSYAAY